MWNSIVEMYSASIKFYSFVHLNLSLRYFLEFHFNQKYFTIFLLMHHKCLTSYECIWYVILYITVGGLPQEFILEAYAMGQKHNPIILKSKWVPFSFLSFLLHIFFSIFEILFFVWKTFLIRCNYLYVQIETKIKAFRINSTLISIENLIQSKKSM